MLVGLIAYLSYAFVTSRNRTSAYECEKVQICVSDSNEAGFVTTAGIISKMKQAHLHPVGKPMDSVSCQCIKDMLLRDPFISEATCYKTPAQQVHIIVAQRVPILRIMADNGDNYYIDESGFKMAPDGYYADLPVVTGNVDHQFASTQLLPIGQMLRQDTFWHDQIEQIHVTPNRELQLTTRIGDLIINAGTPDNMEMKLHKLFVFYHKVLAEVGWNQYSEISIAYSNQVVCKKKKK